MSFYCKLELLYNSGVRTELHLRLKDVEELDELEATLKDSLACGRMRFIGGELHQNALRGGKVIPQTTGATTKDLIYYSIITDEGEA